MLLLTVSATRAEERFPPPQFTETHHVVPPTVVSPPRSAIAEAVDVVVLAVALLLAALFVLKFRSRKAVFALMLACLAYFGFYRKGCICPVGSVQNVAAALADGSALPWTVLAFFLLPLITALLFGRVFCGAVCPLGAIQELVIWWPRRLPSWLNAVLRLGPVVVLVVGVMAAATAMGYPICRFDPFVGIFRGSGALPIWVLTGVVLLAGVFVARPYCRFVCPYGLLLRWTSRLSWRHATVTPGECITCRLCEPACPFDAIDEPTEHRPRDEGKRQLAVVLLLGPVLLAVGAGAGWLLGPAVAGQHPVIQLDAQIQDEEAGFVDRATLASAAFRLTAETPDQLAVRAGHLAMRVRWFVTAGGLFIALVVWLRMVRLSVRRTRTGYEPNRGTCLSCARCFSSCPVPPEGP